MSESKLNELIDAREELTRSYKASLAKIDEAIESLGGKDKVRHEEVHVETKASRLPKATKAEMSHLEAKILAACESCAMSMGAIVAATEAPEARVKPLVGKLTKAGALTRVGGLRDATYKLTIA